MAESTILITTFQRNPQLIWNLKTLVRQELEDVDVIVLDDCWQPDVRCQEVVENYKDRLDISYIHTGQQKDGNYWRVPGFAFNVGAKRTESDFIFLCCAEIYHHNNTVAPMVDLLRQHREKVMIIPIGKTDGNGSITGLLNRDGAISDETYHAIKARLLVNYPFFMGLPRADFLDIGGYDEDFTGVGVEDKDLVERLKWRGGRYIQAPSMILHLHHSKRRIQTAAQEGNVRTRTQYNRNLFVSKRGQVIRNQDREWGVL
jgi:predicted glycosyltransferase involved in capsule biosynthesis